MNKPSIRTALEILIQRVKEQGVTSKHILDEYDRLRGDDVIATTCKYSELPR